MQNEFFKGPILNSPYEYPARHWELDNHGQPTNLIIDARRKAEFISPIPKPKKQRGDKGQAEMVFDEGAGLSTAAQQYDPTPIINALRRRRQPKAVEVTPEPQPLAPEDPPGERPQPG